MGGSGCSSVGWVMGVWVGGEERVYAGCRNGCTGSKSECKSLEECIKVGFQQGKVFHQYK